jgi:hypothetical protein
VGRVPTQTTGSTICIILEYILILKKRKSDRKGGEETRSEKKARRHEPSVPRVLGKFVLKTGLDGVNQGQSHNIIQVRPNTAKKEEENDEKERRR